MDHRTNTAGRRVAAAAGREVVEIVSEPGLEGSRGGAERTLDAMRGGAEVIYQTRLSA